MNLAEPEMLSMIETGTYGDCSQKKIGVVGNSWKQVQ